MYKEYKKMQDSLWPFTMPVCIPAMIDEYDTYDYNIPLFCFVFYICAYYWFCDTFGFTKYYFYIDKFICVHITVKEDKNRSWLLFAFDIITYTTLGVPVPLLTGAGSPDMTSVI